MEHEIFKKCTRCGIMKHSSAFALNKRTKTGLTAPCKACEAQYRADNADVINARRKEKREEKHRRLAMLPPEERAEADPDRQRSLRFNENNRERLRANAAAYRAQNRTQVNANKVERRRRVNEATPGWAKPSDFEDFKVIAMMFRMYTGQSYHVDHIVPLRGKVAGRLVVCGLHCDANMTVVPGEDNQRKSNRRWPDMP